MKKLLTLALVLFVLAAFTGLSVAEEKKAEQQGGPTSTEKTKGKGKMPAYEKKAGEKSPAEAQNTCSEVKMKVLNVLHAAAACAEKATKEGRVNDAKNCWNAFARQASVMSHRTGERIPDSECPHIGPGGGGVDLKITCYHADYLVWCCGGGMCCDSAYGGYGCWLQ